MLCRASLPPVKPVPPPQGEGLGRAKRGAGDQTQITVLYSIPSSLALSATAPALLYLLRGPGQPLDTGYARSNDLTFIPAVVPEGEGMLDF